MGEITRSAIARVGVDLAKNVIQVHAVDATGRRVTARSIKRRTRSAESKGEMWCFSSTIVMPSGTATSRTSERLRTTVSSVFCV